MLFGALTLAVSTTVTSCKDYDDDVKNLQEQIDKITSTNPVSTEDMKAAIASAISTLQAQLQTAIDGKADSKAVQDLLATVTELQTALDNKADASKIQELGDKITALTEEVNAVKGNLEAKQEELAGKVAELEEQLKEAASSADIARLTEDLAAAKNELKTVKEMAENNAAAIVGIQTSITQLKTLEGKVAALEAFKATAATQEDLKRYVETSDLADLVDAQVLNLLKDNGSIAQYVNDAIEAQVLSEASAINVAIKGINTELATLSADFEAYKGTQTTKYNDLSGKITALETFKNDITNSLAGTTYKDFADMLAEIASLRSDYANCITTSNLGASVNTYLSECIGKADTAFGALEMRVKALENQIQSVTYIPEYEDGKVVFMSYFYANKLVAATKPIQVKFRISPATTLKDLEENYTPTFEGEEIKTRAAAEIYHIENIEMDEATGIATYTLSTSTEKSYAVSLNLVAKDSKENRTNISSNYFPVISDYRAITSVAVYSPNEDVASILYDKELSVIDYATDAVLEVTGTDRAGNAVTSEAMAKSVNADNFKVAYGLKAEGADNDFYVIGADGILKLKTYDATSNGKKVTAQATVTITGTEYKNVVDFAEVAAKAASADPVLTPSITPTQFDGTKEHVATVAVNYTTAGTSQAVYEALPKANFTFTADKGVSLRFKEGTTKNELEIVVPKGTVANTYTPNVVVIVSDVQKFTLKPSITVQIKSADYTLAYNTNIASANMQLTANLTPLDKPTAMNYSCSITPLFENYATIKANAEKVGGAIELSLKDAITGVSIVDNVLKIDNTYSNSPALPALPKSIVVIAKVAATNAAGAAYDLVVDKETTFTLNDLSGKWTAPTSATVKIGSGEVNAVQKLATGAKWTASNSKDMWEAGKEVAIGTNWGAAPLAIFGFEAPTFVLANEADALYVTLNKNNGELALTEQGKLLKNLITVTVDIVAKSRWGTITDYATGKTVTVKINPTVEASAIN